MQPVNIHTFDPGTVLSQSAELIATHLHETLMRNQVFLLLSGGSAISLYDSIFRMLIAQQAPLHQLTLSLADERFVEKRNPDSNEQQIVETGLMSLLLPLGVKWVGLLDEVKKTGPEQAQHISQLFDQVLATSPKVMMIMGMGDDGHTAGLLPTGEQSPNRQLLTESQANIVFYIVNPSDSNNPYKQRLTTTPYFFTKADHVFVYATGEKKKEALEKLQEGTVPINECPAIALRYSKNPVRVLTDVETGQLDPSSKT